MKQKLFMSSLVVIGLSLMAFAFFKYRAYIFPASDTSKSTSSPLTLVRDVNLPGWQPQVAKAQLEAGR